MRQIDGKYQCLCCGETFEVPDGPEPKVVFVAASGKPNLRTIRVGSQIVHQCVVDPDPDLTS